MESDYTPRGEWGRVETQRLIGLKGFVSHTLNFLISPFTLMFTKNIKEQKTRAFIKLVSLLWPTSDYSKDTVH